MDYDNLENAVKAVNFHCSTDGSGYWSQTVATVRCTRLHIAYVADLDEGDEQPTFGELRVGFDTKTWSPPKDGLIYTDKAFEAELRDALVKLGFTRLAVDNIGYSEQGMQGHDYVSLDVGMVFLAEARNIFASGE